MANTIILKNGSGVPANGTLQAGEVAIDLVGKKLYSSTNGTDIFTIGGGGMKYATPSNNVKVTFDRETTISENGADTVTRSLQVMHPGVVRISYEIKKSDTSRSHYININNSTGAYYNTTGVTASNYGGIDNPVYDSNPLNGQSNDTYVQFSHDVTVCEAGYIMLTYHLSGSQSGSTGNIRNVRISYDTTDVEPTSLGVHLGDWVS